jgi:hypothetical protein
MMILNLIQRALEYGKCVKCLAAMLKAAGDTKKGKKPLHMPFQDAEVFLKLFSHFRKTHRG